MSKILMMLLTTVLLQPKNHNQFHSGNCIALTTGVFFGKIGAQEQRVVLSLIRDLSLEMPAEKKARSGLMLAGGIISSKLEAFCIKYLLPPPEKERSLS